jgi:hypothetical protein
MEPYFVLPTARTWVVESNKNEMAKTATIIFFILLSPSFG